MKYTFETALFLLIFFISQGSFAQHVSIIESQSFSTGHDMDDKWYDVADQLGFTATILGQDGLSDLSLLDNTDILIVASGVIDFTSESYLQTIIEFVESGRPAYIQSEYETFFQGNVTFDSLMNHFEADFEWNNSIGGDLQPMMVVGGLSTTPNLVGSLSYFWYGCTGSGQDVSPFLEYQGDYFGFVYSDMNNSNGTVVTTSDQDWIRTGVSTDLMENILSLLAESSMTSSLNAQNRALNKMRIYPNPTSGSFQLDFVEVQNEVRVKLLDLEGRTIYYSTEYHVSQLQINTELEPGFYVLQVSNDENASVSKRLIITE